MATQLRKLVSKEKKRYTQDGYDLDLTYITENVIAMGYPSSGAESVYRNPISMVLKLFNEKHQGVHKIYNLCSERAYNIEGSFHKVARWGFNDHNPCPFEMLPPLMESIDEWLHDNPAHVVGVHCKAGKGRTGLVISAYLLHSGDESTAHNALFKFGSTRTSNNKGVTIPSQMRFVHYYEQLLRRGTVVTSTYFITHIRFIGVPNFDVGGGCDPYFVVEKATLAGGGGEEGDNVRMEKLYNYKTEQAKGHVRKFRPEDRFVDLDCMVEVSGSIKITFFDEDLYSADDKMCHLWFHTGFIENDYLCFEKTFIDKACKDKRNRHFDPNFKIEIFLHKCEGADERAERIIAPQSAAMRRRAGVGQGEPLPDYVAPPGADVPLIPAADAAGSGQT